MPIRSIRERVLGIYIMFTIILQPSFSVSCFPDSGFPKLITKHHFVLPERLKFCYGYLEYRFLVQTFLLLKVIMFSQPEPVKDGIIVESSI